jgi:hypothetical protein
MRMHNQLEELIERQEQMQTILEQQVIRQAQLEQALAKLSMQRPVYNIYYDSSSSVPGPAMGYVLPFGASWQPMLAPTSTSGHSPAVMSHGVLAPSSNLAQFTSASNNAVMPGVGGSNVTSGLAPGQMGDSFLPPGAMPGPMGGSNIPVGPAPDQMGGGNVTAASVPVQMSGGNVTAGPAPGQMGGFVFFPGPVPGPMGGVYFTYAQAFGQMVGSHLAPGAMPGPMGGGSISPAAGSAGVGVGNPGISMPQPEQVGRSKRHQSDSRLCAACCS